MFILPKPASAKVYYYMISIINDHYVLINGIVSSVLLKMSYF